jgi:hypothetical protein
MQPREVTSGTSPRPPPHTSEKDEEYYDNAPVLVEVPGQQAEAEAAVAVRRTDEDIIPDGGLIAWLQVVGSWLLFFNSWYGSTPFAQTPWNTAFGEEGTKQHNTY